MCVCLLSVQLQQSISNDYVAKSYVRCTDNIVSMLFNAVVCIYITPIIIVYLCPPIMSFDHINFS